MDEKRARSLDDLVLRERQGQRPTNPSFPRWSGPLLGAAVGVLLSLRALRGEGAFEAAYPAFGAALGALAGSVMWLLDVRPGEPRRASALGTVLGVLAIFPGMFPAIGLLFSLPAFVVNRRVTGWQNRNSRLGLGVCVVITVLVLAAILVPLS